MIFPVGDGRRCVEMRVWAPVGLICLSCIFSVPSLAPWRIVGTVRWTPPLFLETCGDHILTAMGSKEQKAPPLSSLIVLARHYWKAHCSPTILLMLRERPSTFESRGRSTDWKWHPEWHTIQLIQHHKAMWVIDGNPFFPDWVEETCQDVCASYWLKERLGKNARKARPNWWDGCNMI